MKKSFVSLCLLASFVAFTGCSNAGESTAAGEIVPGIPVKNTVTLVDLGAKTCIPCKMMAPILRDLAREYEGKAAVIFIDVWKNPAPARQTGIRVIPTQIFYDKQGKEVGRHEGFLDKKSIVAAFEKLGVK